MAGNIEKLIVQALGQWKNWVWGNRAPNWWLFKGGKWHWVEAGPLDHLKSKDRVVVSWELKHPASPISSWILAMIFLHGILVWSEVPRTVPSSLSGNNVIRLVFKLQIILKQGSHSVLSHTRISLLYRKCCYKCSYWAHPVTAHAQTQGLCPKIPGLATTWFLYLWKLNNPCFSAVTTRWPLRFHDYAIWPHLAVWNHPQFCDSSTTHCKWIHRFFSSCKTHLISCQFLKLSLPTKVTTEV